MHACKVHIILVAARLMQGGGATSARGQVLETLQRVVVVPVHCDHLCVQDHLRAAACGSHHLLH